MPDLQQQEYASQTRFGTREAAPERPQGVQEERQARVVAGGSATESLAGIATVVLAIIGLSVHGVLSNYLMAIAAIVAGGGLIVHGTGLAARLRDVLAQTAEAAGEEVDAGIGVSVEVIAGVAGIVLGILALIGFVPTVLGPVALLAFGGGFLLSAGVATELNEIQTSRIPQTAAGRQVTGRATVGAAGIQALSGIAAVVLGILAITGLAPLTLTLVGFLCIGGGMLLSGGAVSARMLTLFSRR